MFCNKNRLNRIDPIIPLSYTMVECPRCGTIIKYNEYTVKDTRYVDIKEPPSYGEYRKYVDCPKCEFRIIVK